MESHTHTPSTSIAAALSVGLAKLGFDAAIFDMDGVLTETATVHAEAWKRLFEDYLGGRQSTETGKRYRQSFDDDDYRRYVDGRPRLEGVESFLKSRGIVLPLGSAADPANAETVHGLGNRKNEIFRQILEKEGVGVFKTTVRLIEALRMAGVKVGLATSSKNSELVLSRTGTTHLFSTIVDGIVSEKTRLKGKPHPDIFLAAARNLGTVPDRAIVVEDAVTGVAAGAAGHFGLVIGVARSENASELLENGADVVVGDLGEISLKEISRRIRLKARTRQY